MKKEVLVDLMPRSVFAYFEALCSIPHGSGNTKEISDYLVSFAKEQGLHWLQDESNNVIIFKEGTPGREEEEPVILQSHMDMVCQKEPHCKIDMQKDPLQLACDGKYVFAEGTTLGADDGIGVALSLAILAETEIDHPPLEIVITADEETGLIGANAIDLSMLRGRRMLNLDTPYDHVFNVGCGGGARVSMEMAVERECFAGELVKLSLEHFHGGHSGSQIGKGYVNANKAMADLLDKLNAAGTMRLAELSGGSAGNVIPSTAHAVFAVENMSLVDLESQCTMFVQQLREKFNEPDATAAVSILPMKTSMILTSQSTKKTLGFLQDLPDGVQLWSQDFENLPLTSLNLGIMELKKDVLSILTTVRSGKNQRRQELLEILQKFSDTHHCTYQESGVYSAWEYREDSALRDAVVALYRKRNHKEPVVRVVHSGLECGVLGEKIPDLDCVSMGPNIFDIHTTRERLEIASVKRTWEFLLEILKNL